MRTNSYRFLGSDKQLADSRLNDPAKARPWVYWRAEFMRISNPTRPMIHRDMVAHRVTSVLRLDVRRGSIGGSILAAANDQIPFAS